MSERSWTPDERVAEIRKIAARVVTMTQGESTREVIDALALAAGALVHNSSHTPLARQRVVQQFAQHFCKAAEGRDII